MKKYLSVFYLAARESFRKIILLWILSFLIQGALCIISASYVDLTKTPVVTTESLFDKFLPLCFGLTFAFMAGFLMKTRKKSVSSINYTLKRLLIKEKTVFLIRALYNTLILLMFLMLSVVLYFFIASAVIKLFPENYFSSQAAYMSLYRYELFHNIFAGRDILRLTRNILLILATAVNLSADSFYANRNSQWFGAYFSVLVCFRAFAKGSDMSIFISDVFDIVVAVILIVCTIAAVFTKEEQYE